MLDELKEECGVFGVFNANDGIDVARLSYYALYALQHRGQESCGIAVSTEGSCLYHKDMGLVSDVFDNMVLDYLKGTHAVGHVRYSTTGENHRDNAQPLVVKYRDGRMALAHNGNLVNAVALRDEMESTGSIFMSSSDTEVIAKLISRYRISSPHIEQAIEKSMAVIKGSYAVVISTPNKLIGFRDPYGIRPLCLGKISNSYVFASESCALDAIGAKFIRNVEPGEIVVIDKDGLHNYSCLKADKSSLCIFEFIYFARPDSYIDGASVHEVRLEMGKRLAAAYPVDADLVIGVPDSALSAAMGYSRGSGIAYGHGLIRNRYVGRTFIQPTQEMRDNAVKIKFSVSRSEIEGKSIVVVDDSIVRGTTTRVIIQMLREAGAREVHMRVSSPPVKYPCYYGVDISAPGQLVAARLSSEEIRQMIGADSLGYLSIEDMLAAAEHTVQLGLCDACFSGQYCIGTPEDN